MGDMTGLFGDVMKMGIGLEMMKNMGGIMKDTMNSAGAAGSNMAGAINMGAQAPGGAVVPPGSGEIPNPYAGMNNPYGAAPQGASAQASSQGAPAQEAPQAPAAPAGWTCACGRVNPEDARFCGGCGSKRPEPEGPWTCACGRENPADSLFCGGCGKKRGEE